MSDGAWPLGATLKWMFKKKSQMHTHSLFVWTVVEFVS